MQDDRDGEPEIEQLLTEITTGSMPKHSRDLVQRTIDRVQRLILLGDLLRFATFDAIWNRARRRNDSARKVEERHNRQWTKTK